MKLLENSLSKGISIEELCCCKLRGCVKTSEGVDVGRSWVWCTVSQHTPPSKFCYLSAEVKSDLCHPLKREAEGLCWRVSFFVTYISSLFHVKIPSRHGPSANTQGELPVSFCSLTDPPQLDAALTTLTCFKSLRTCGLDVLNMRFFCPASACNTRSRCWGDSVHSVLSSVHVLMQQSHWKQQKFLWSWWAAHGAVVAGIPVGATLLYLTWDL